MAVTENADLDQTGPDAPPDLPELVWQCFLQYASKPRPEDGNRFMLQRVKNIDFSKFTPSSGHATHSAKQSADNSKYSIFATFVPRLQDFRKFLADAELIDGVHLKQSNVVSFFTRFATAGKDATLDPYQVCLATR